MGNLRSQVFRGLKWQAISIVGRQGLSFVVFTTLARLLNPSAIGQVGLVAVYLGLVSMLAEQSIGAALIQRATLDDDHIHTAFWINLSYAVILCGSTIAFAVPIASLLGDTALTPLLRWSSLGLILNALSTIHSTLFVKAMDFRQPTIRGLMAQLVGGGIGVVMAFGGYGPWALVAQQLGAAAAGTIFLWIVSEYRPRLRFSRAHLRDLFSVSSSISVTTLLWFISSRIDQIIISRYAGVSAVGIYVVGNKLPEMARVITHEPLANISLPALARLQHDFRQMRETTYEGMELNATISFALFIGIAITAGDIVPLIFGAQWAGAGQIASVLSILALVNVLSVFFHPLLLASGCAGRYALLSFLNAGGTVVACLIGIRFSVFYLVVGLLVNNLVNLIPCLILLRRKIGLSAVKYYFPCVMPACAAITMVAATRLVTLLPAETPTATLLTCKVLMGAAAYGGFLLVFKRSSIDKLIAGMRRALEP